MIARITRVYTRCYRDNKQVTTYVEWVDDRGEAGRTAGSSTNAHMLSLMARAKHEGVPHTREEW